MKNLLKKIIYTSRLKLVPISLTYKDIIFAEFTPEITAYMHPRSAKHVSEIIDFIDNSLVGMKKGSNLQMVALKKVGNEFLGCAGLHNIDTTTPKVGIWIKKSAHGHKYGQEAMRALKIWADENLDYEHILYLVEQDNIPSRKVVESLGGKIARKFSKYNMSGRLQDMLEYRIYPENY
ncbi:MAG: GNAT family N-acetyltransferase [Parcubacteria group bacterium]|nr:GNAT family N-acetyltransferase [Parcubacteria group bacterium]